MWTELVSQTEVDQWLAPKLLITPQGYNHFNGLVEWKSDFMLGEKQFHRSNFELVKLLCFFTLECVSIQLFGYNLPDKLF